MKRISLVGPRAPQPQSATCQVRAAPIRPAAHPWWRWL